MHRVKNHKLIVFRMTLVRMWIYPQGISVSSLCMLIIEHLQPGFHCPLIRVHFFNYGFQVTDISLEELLLHYESPCQQLGLQCGHITSK